MNRVLVKTHEAWLAMLMASFMSRKSDNRETLQEFSEILFRHFTWIEHDLIRHEKEYDYDRETIPIKVSRLTAMLRHLAERLSELDLLLVGCSDEALRERMRSDLEYMRYALGRLEEEEIHAFDMHRRYRGLELSAEATDALTLFLFEESYKEYELIMIYNYLRAHSDDFYLNRIFGILVEESFFHLRSFGRMMAEMGILGVPRVIHRSLYQVQDVVKFLEEGIEEELAAKEQCRELSEAVAAQSEELAKFFDFINHQENYHIALMKEALQRYRTEGPDGR